MSLQREILSPVTTAGLLYEQEQGSAQAKPCTSSTSIEVTSLIGKGSANRHAQRVKHHPNCHCFRCHPENMCKDPRKGSITLFAKSKEELNEINNRRKQTIKKMWQNEDYKRRQMLTRRKPEQRKLHGKILSQWNKEHREEFLENSIKGTKSLKRKDTDIELLMKDGLINLGFLPQQRIKNICIPDFVNFQYKTAVFCDGKYWHEKPSVKKRDKKINKKLQLLNFKVLRFTDRDIKQNLDECFKQVKLALGFHGCTPVFPAIQPNG